MLCDYFFYGSKNKYPYFKLLNKFMYVLTVHWFALVVTKKYKFHNDN